MRPRGVRARAASVTVVVALGATSCTSPPERPDGPAPVATAEPSGASLRRYEDMVCGVPGAWGRRILRGYHPERSGEIQLLPRQPHVVEAWLSHAGPWEHLQRVPLFLYGPGHVPASGRVDREATLADLAPTLAEHLRFPFDAPDGTALEEAAPVSHAPPRLVVTVVWDSAGMNVLEEHPDAWPILRRLIPDGVWFERAWVGTSPSTTPAVHGTIGTGAFPRRHGLIDLRFRLGDRIAWIGEERPDYLQVPTLTDRYTAATKPVPRAALVASPATLGMLGHGSFLEGGARHVVAMHRDGRWGIGEHHEEFFRFPAYVQEVGGLDEAVRRLDLEDGRLDGRWLGERVLDEENLSFSPAWSEHQTRVVDEVVRREGLGQGAVPDLLFVNYKQIDTVGHRWTMNSPQMEAVVRSTDAALGALVELLDREVGEGEWVLAVTADHGSVPDPEVSGAFVITLRNLMADLRARFDHGDETVFQRIRPTQLWVDVERLAANGFTLAEVADAIAAHTKADNAADPAEVPEEERDDPLFAAAFPSVALETAPCLSPG